MTVCFLFSFLVACAGIIFLTYTTSSQSTDKIFGKPLFHAFSDKPPIIYGIICTISVTSAIALELFLDFIIESEYSTDDLGERLAMILVIIIPGVFILRSSDHRDFVFIFSAWHTIQTIGCSAPIYSLCCKLVPTHFNRPLLLFSYMLWAFSGVTSICGFGRPFLCWANLLTLSCASLSLIFLGIIVWDWFSNLRRNKNSGSFPASGFVAFVQLFNVEEICCLLYLCCNLSTIVIVPSIVGALKYFSWENLDRADVCVFIYSLAAFSVLPSCIPGRIVRHAARLHEHKTQTNFALIRYVSHEIRTPLNVIQNGLELLSEDVEKNCSEETVCILNDVKSASVDTINIVDDLLGVHKINAGTFSMERRFEHVNCLQKIAQSCQSVVQRKDLSFYLENHLLSTDSEDDAKLCIDSEKVGQALRSIVSYATKFTPAGGFVRIVLQYLPNVQQKTHLKSPQTEIFPNEISRISILKSVQKKIRYIASSSSPKHSQENVVSRGQKRRPFKPDASRPHIFPEGQENEHIGTAVLKVSSSGAGLCSIQAKKILSECSEFDERALHGGGGSGLPLLIFQEIIQNNSGKIKVGISNAESTVSVSFKCYRINLNKNYCVNEGDPHSVAQDLISHQSLCLPESILNVRSLEVAQSCVEKEEVAKPFRNKSSRKQTCRVHAETEEPELFLEKENETPQASAFAIALTPFNFSSKTPTRMHHSDSLRSSFIESTCEVVLRVLVVDDIKMNRKMIQRMLNQFKFEAVMPSSHTLELQITEADDGTSALDCIEKSICPFDVIFMDNIMTKMNGPQAAAVMREKNFSGMIIGVTGNVLDEDIADFILHGASLILPKPLSKPKLVDVLWKVIDGKLSSN